jgi:sulfite reductase (NADPH) flavoprotein alpha-component
LVQKSTFLATIKERYCLNPGSEKATYHVVLDLSGSDIEYAVGDCLGVYPQNDPEQVNQVIRSLNAHGNEIIDDRNGSKHALRSFLSDHASLLRIPKCNLSDGFCKKLAPMFPRFYSIASSMRMVGKEAHLTVGLVDGTCSQYICNRAPLDKPILSVFHQPSHNFFLPQDACEKPVIMIGPGTGIAPFRGFMQERAAQYGSEKNWLFFGERHGKRDFYYQSFWEMLVREQKLIVDTAFSRDQPERIYVQHKMLEKSRLLWEWIQEGGYIFVCGNADKMAKDVEKTLQAILQMEGKCTAEEAKALLKVMKKNGRYQKDVY